MQTDEIPEEEEVKTALAAVFNQHSAKWVRIGTAILRNQDDAEDVLHEAICRVLKRNPHLPSLEELRLYLGRAVGNTAFEFYKRRKRERKQYAPIVEKILARSELKHIDPFRPDFIMENEECYIEREKQRRLLRRCLNDLPLKQYEAVQMTMLGDDNMTFRDMELASGIPRSTIRHRSKQGLRTLRKYMKREMLLDEHVKR